MPAEQRSSAVSQLPPQQGRPSPPHATHVVPSHAVPMLHCPAQHGCPSVPQPAHPPSSHSSRAQGGGPTFAHRPSLHRSAPLQKSPSSQSPSVGSCAHIPASQMSSVQLSPSSQWRSTRHSVPVAPPRRQRWATQRHPSGQVSSLVQAYAPSRSAGAQPASEHAATHTAKPARTRAIRTSLARRAPRARPAPSARPTRTTRRSPRERSPRRAPRAPSPPPRCPRR